MYKIMLKNQRVTFVSDYEQATKHSPFHAWFNKKSGKYVVTDKNNNSAIAAGLDEDEAHACVMFKANQYIARNLAA